MEFLCYVHTLCGYVYASSLGIGIPSRIFHNIPIFDPIGTNALKDNKIFLRHIWD